MVISGVEETITVTAETPVVDIRKMGTETTVDSDELEGIPTSRDPWALMRTVPGVQVDKLNVAGSESGQQSNYFGKGAYWKNNTWSMDGIVITDMSTSGSSPGYYTYDTFDEVSVTTGGADITSATGGVHMSFVTKRGTNTPQGSFAFNWADNALQSSNIPDELVGDPRLQVATRPTTPTTLPTGASISAAPSSRTSSGPTAASGTTISKSSPSPRPVTGRSSETSWPRPTGRQARRTTSPTSTSSTPRPRPAVRRVEV